MGSRGGASCTYERTRIHGPAIDWLAHGVLFFWFFFFWLVDSRMVVLIRLKGVVGILIECTLWYCSTCNWIVREP